MTPFLQLRLWLRQAPAVERVLGCGAAGLAAALLLWVVIPPGLAGPSGAGGPTALGTSTDASGTTGPAQGAAGQAVTPQPVGGQGGRAPANATGGLIGPGTTGSVTGTASGAVVVGPSAPTARGKTCQPGSGPGVSATTITIGAVLVDLGPVGDAIALPSYDEQVRAFNALLAYYNKAGAAGCRRFVGRYYHDNPLDAASEHAVCLQLVQDKVFAVLANLANVTENTCIAQQKIPNIWYLSPYTPYVKKYRPYILSFAPDEDRILKDYVFGAQQQGWFAGMKKLGVTEESCLPEKNSTLLSDLAQVGIPASKVSVFSYGCASSGQYPPSAQQQAVLQFERDGVTHVMTSAYSQYGAFSSAADAQQFHPKYAIFQDGQMSVAEHATNPPSQGFDGALGITSDQLGANNAPGAPLTPETTTCAKILVAAGLRPPTTTPLFGADCDLVEMLAAAVPRMPSVTRENLAVGAAMIGKYDFSFLAGPSDFHDPAMPTGGQFWRPTHYDVSCPCWRITSPTWRKSFS